MSLLARAGVLAGICIAALELARKGSAASHLVRKVALTTESRGLGVATPWRGRRCKNCFVRSQRAEVTR